MTNLCALTNRDEILTGLEHQMIEGAAHIIDKLSVEGVVESVSIFRELPQRAHNIGSQEAAIEFYKILEKRVEEETAVVSSKLLAVLNYLYAYPSKLPKYGNYFPCCYACSGFKPKDPEAFEEVRKLLKEAEKIRTDNAKILREEGLEYLAGRLVNERMTDLLPIKRDPNQAIDAKHKSESLGDGKAGVVIIEQCSTDAPLMASRSRAASRTNRSYSIYVVAQGKMRRILTTPHEIAVAGLEDDHVVFSFYIPVWDSRRQHQYFVYVGDETEKQKLFGMRDILHPAPGNWGD